jgi:hypothetical protein
MPLKAIKIKFALPWIGEIGGEWEPDESEVKAAWELYVELATRISIVELQPEEGLLREALDSLYSLFSTTREILRKYGPTVGKPKGENRLSFGLLAVAVLNTVLHPVLSKWHPVLEDYESTKPAGVSPLEHEKRWEKAKELRDTLNDVRSKLMEYGDILAEVAGLPSLLPQQHKTK